MEKYTDSSLMPDEIERLIESAKMAPPMPEAEMRILDKQLSTEEFKSFGSSVARRILKRAGIEIENDPYPQE